MIRFFLVLAAIFCCGPAHAGERAVLSSPSDTVQLRAGTANLFAYFQHGERGFVVTVLLSGAEGEALRNRVSLTDGQSHAIHVGEDEVEAGARVSLRRIGDAVEVIGSATPGLGRQASN